MISAPMVWFDPKKGRYRTSITHKVFYGFGWPVMRFFAFRCMSSDRAHHLGIRMIGVIGTIDLFVTGWRRLECDNTTETTEDQP